MRFILIVAAMLAGLALGVLGTGITLAEPRIERLRIDGCEVRLGKPPWLRVTLKPDEQRGGYQEALDHEELGYVLFSERDRYRLERTWTECTGSKLRWID